MQCRLGRLREVQTAHAAPPLLEHAHTKRRILYMKLMSGVRKCSVVSKEVLYTANKLMYGVYYVKNVDVLLRQLAMSFGSSEGRLNSSCFSPTT